MLKLKRVSLLRRIVFWDFKRGSWQYDLLLLAIVAFIFVPSREFFRDQPRAASIVMLPTDSEGEHFLLEPKLLDGIAAGDRVAKATELVRARFKVRSPIQRVEPLLDSEQEVIGYSATAPKK